ncbi:Uncharacterized protein dnm_002880 [Desulfonema magnum]|uniref:Uncharacterized protein n=1 Tax=Desulfonema magnum TaxID=45655 RepID=A0A975BFL1_9BACT|nr:Uncharacterized protein dnm_002880 [Desulfonema magnum]
MKNHIVTFFKHRFSKFRNILISILISKGYNKNLIISHIVKRIIEGRKEVKML